MWLTAPFTAIAAGTTSSGKTHLLSCLIKGAQEISKPPPVDITYCYGANHSAFAALRPHVKFYERPIDVVADIPKDGKHQLLILNDLMGEASNNSEMAALYTNHSHHMNLFFVFQNLFWKGERTMSINRGPRLIVPQPKSKFFKYFFSLNLKPDQT